MSLSAKLNCNSFVHNSTIPRNSNLEMLRFWKWFWGTLCKTRRILRKVFFCFCFMMLNGEPCSLFKTLISNEHLFKIHTHIDYIINQDPLSRPSCAVSVISPTKLKFRTKDKVANITQTSLSLFKGAKTFPS